MKRKIKVDKNNFNSKRVSKLNSNKIRTNRCVIMININNNRKIKYKQII